MHLNIITTTNSEQIAKAISKAILDNNLSPCVQITHNAISFFKWNNKITTEKEYIINIKTIIKFERNIVQIISDLHNYKTPEIIKNEFKILTKDYKNWFNNNLKK